MNETSKKYRILVADDSEDAKTLIGIALEDRDYEIVFASDGDEALESLKTEAPDLALLDVQMPGLTGIEVCTWIKTNLSEHFIPTLLVTSMSDTEDKVRGLDCGADDYVTKPFALPELRARVAAFLRIKELTDELKTNTPLARG